MRRGHLSRFGMAFIGPTCLPHDPISRSPFPVHQLWWKHHVGAQGVAAQAASASLSAETGQSSPLHSILLLTVPSCPLPCPTDNGNDHDDFDASGSSPPAATSRPLRPAPLLDLSSSAPQERPSARPRGRYAPPSPSPSTETSTTLSTHQPREVGGRRHKGTAQGGKIRRHAGVSCYPSTHMQLPYRSLAQGMWVCGSRARLAWSFLQVLVLRRTALCPRSDCTGR